jgi:hypothetical protein
VQPPVGDESGRGAHELCGDSRGEGSVRVVKIGRRAEQGVRRRVVGPRRARGDDLGHFGAGPPVVEGQRGTVVDEVGLAVPTEHVDVAPRTVHVADKGVEPQHATGEAGVDREGAGVEVERAGQEVHAEVQAGAAAQQILHLLIRFGRAERGVELDGHQRGHRQPEPPGQLAADDLRDEHRQPLAGAGVLHHVGAQVVRLHQARQRPPRAAG